MGDHTIDETDYDLDRRERAIHRIGREQGLSRRQLLQAGAAAVPLLATLGRTPLAHAQTPAPPPAPPAAAGPIVKPLPPEWFNLFGTNAEMRWDAAGRLGYEIPADSPPLTRQVVKSAFELPFGAELPQGRRTWLPGRSWSGDDAPIRAVEVSADGGASWRRARLHGRNERNAWVRWSAPVKPRAAGPAELLARAIDRRGNAQPATVPFNAQGYLFGAVVRHPVTVA